MVRKNKYSLAVGFRYDDQAKKGADADEAPVVTVKGEELRADELVKIAERYGVPIIEDGDLAEALQPVEIDSQIPANLYRAVALILNELKKQGKGNR